MGLFPHIFNCVFPNAQSTWVLLIFPCPSSSSSQSGLISGRGVDELKGSFYLTKNSLYNCVLSKHVNDHLLSRLPFPPYILTRLP
jgi:hypothetical protein